MADMEGKPNLPSVEGLAILGLKNKEGVSKFAGFLGTFWFVEG